jgi:hypothetical protein
VLFADITGSTTLYETLGDQEASRVVKLCLDEMKAATEQHRGIVVETIGDEILSTFASAEYASLAADSMMRRIEKLPPVNGRPLSLRIGFHFGPVLQENGKLFGDTINTAARIVALARARQIFASKTAVDLLPTFMRNNTRDIAAFNLKGKREEMDICEILWQGEHSELTVQYKSGPEKTVKQRLLVKPSPEKLHVLDAHTSQLTLGRGTENTIIIDNLRVSRHHAKIELRRDKFVITDSSTNGTWVLFDGKSEVLLRHEELALQGRGLISLGHPYDPNDNVGTLRFEEA